MTKRHHFSLIVPQYDGCQDGQQLLREKDCDSSNNSGSDIEDEENITIDDAIVKLSFGRFQLQLMFVVGLCLASDALEVTLLAYLSAILRYEWHLSSIQTASITSSVFLGQLVGTLVLGSLGDRYGRRPIILFSSIIISVFGLVTAMARNLVSLILIRTILGFGIGGFVVPFDILAEFLPSEGRGKYLLSVEYFWTFGTVLVSVFAYLTIGHQTESSSSWRVFVLACALPSLLASFAACVWIPESPHWLVTQGRTEEALVILRNAADMNGLDSMEIFPHSVDIMKSGSSSTIGMNDKDEEGCVRCAELLQPKWRTLNVLLWCAWFGMAFGYYGVILLITRVFQEKSPGQEPLFNFSSILVSSSAEFLGLTASIIIVESVGRIRPQALFFFGGGIFSLLLSLSASAGLSVYFLTAIAFCLKVAEMGASTLLWVTTAESLPTEIRTTGHSVANAVARMGGFLCPFLVQDITPFWIVGSTMFLLHTVSAFCVLWLPETKRRKLGAVS